MIRIIEKNKINESFRLNPLPRSDYKLYGNEVRGGFIGDFELDDDTEVTIVVAEEPEPRGDVGDVIYYVIVELDGAYLGSSRPESTEKDATELAKKVASKIQSSKTSYQARKAVSSFSSMVVY